MSIVSRGRPSALQSLAVLLLFCLPALAPAQEREELIASPKYDEKAVEPTFIELTAEQVVNLDSATTVNGQDIDIKVMDGKVMVDGAEVVATDIQTTNGVIHVIDSVILPPEDKKISAHEAREMIEHAAQQFPREASCDVVWFFRLGRCTPF